MASLSELLTNELQNLAESPPNFVKVLMAFRLPVYRSKDLEKQSKEIFGKALWLVIPAHFYVLTLVSKGTVFGAPAKLLASSLVLIAVFMLGYVLAVLNKPSSSRQWSKWARKWTVLLFSNWAFGIGLMAILAAVYQLFFQGEYDTVTLFVGELTFQGTNQGTSIGAWCLLSALCGFFLIIPVKKLLAAARRYYFNLQFQIPTYQNSEIGISLMQSALTVAVSTLLLFFSTYIVVKS